ncbi:MAG: hypothetical protein EOP84_02510 [Verrucomicrobiaceae bacterium]|nr:MAG: hypothetical protein EOP84_02510 [Verrucomicrobiaceae bacterium]
MFFQESKPLSAVRMSRDDVIGGVARFLEFREVPLTDRTERLPVFEAVGFANMSAGGEFINTEK